MPSLSVFALLAACLDPAPADVPPADVDPPDVAAPLRPAPAGLRTLTPAQYEASVRAVLDLDVPVARVGAWATSVAAAQGGVGGPTVMAYEDAAREVAAWVFGDEALRDALVGCTPVAAPDDVCTRAFLERVGRRAFRRALDAAEVDRWAGLAASTGAASDPWMGLQLALSGLLQSPHFLYRVELGEPEEEDRLRYTDAELATRLAYLLWGRPPDDALLDAVDAGALSTDEGVAYEVDRMLASPWAEDGVAAFLAELLQVDALRELAKDPALYPDFPAQRDALAVQLVDTAAAAVAYGGLQALWTTPVMVVDPVTAPLFGIPPSSLTGLTQVDVLPQRAGVLTHPGLLAIHAYPGKTSPALRGLYVRKQLLCQEIQPPPPGVSTVLPEPVEGDLVTTRELVSLHQTQPACAACHRYMDPIGLGLEAYDAVGQWRETQNGLEIDPSGDLDGASFADAVALGAALADHPRLLPCLAGHIVAYADGVTVDAAHPEIAGLGSDGDLRRLLRAVALSDMFRYAWEPTP